MNQPPPLPSEVVSPEPFKPVKRSLWGHFLHCMRHYADFSGRSTRAEFFSFNAIIALGMVILSIPVFGTATQILRQMEQDEEVFRDGVSCMLYSALERPSFKVDSLLPNTPMFRLQYDSDTDELQLYELWEEQDIVFEHNETVLGAINNKAVRDAAVVRMVMQIGEESLRSIGFSFFAMIIWGMGFLIPALAVCWRRLHDIGLSGAFYCLVFLPFGNIILSVMFLIDSKPGANIYGLPTKYP